MKITTYSPAETKRVASDLAQTLKGGESIALVGELGTGKTTFVQGLAKALGSRVKVKSPTFTLMNLYPVKRRRIRYLVHVDYFRAPGGADLGLEDLTGPDTVVVAEWPAFVPQNKNVVTIYFYHGESPQARKLKITRQPHGKFPRR